VKGRGAACSLRVSLSAFSARRRIARRQGPLRLKRARLRCGDTARNSDRHTTECEEKFSLIGGAHPKCGLDLLKSRLGPARNFG